MKIEMATARDQQQKKITQKPHTNRLKYDIVALIGVVAFVANIAAIVVAIVGTILSIVNKIVQRSMASLNEIARFPTKWKRVAERSA